MGQGIKEREGEWGSRQKRKWEKCEKENGEWGQERKEV